MVDRPTTLPPKSTEILGEKVHSGDEEKPKRMALVAYIGIGDILIARQYDKDSKKWDDVEIQGLDEFFLVHHNVYVAVAAMHDRNMIFLQTPEGPVKAIRHNINSDEWSVDFTVPGNGLTGDMEALVLLGLDVYLVKDGDFKILGTFESGDFVVEDNSEPEFVNRYGNLFLTPPSGARHNYDVSRYTPRNTMGW
ncbi:hypothetical protein FAUST_8096 [Fusarium austroamericanum]|uniref:Uncharacterized protein n=1 Tax=Fusarium austroamericanum TaxID=282268 RepID=A0AAN5Z595_FUSAU|nr:hypothetical protein FAUST_8096 [Fusarium austroamericanum]